MFGLESWDAYDSWLSIKTCVDSWGAATQGTNTSLKTSQYCYIRIASPYKRSQNWVFITRKGASLKRQLV